MILLTRFSELKFENKLQGREIWGYVMHEAGMEWLTDNKKSIVMDCGIHAREWMSPGK